MVILFICYNLVNWKYVLNYADYINVICILYFLWYVRNTGKILNGKKFSQENIKWKI